MYNDELENSVSCNDSDSTEEESNSDEELCNESDIKLRRKGFYLDYIYLLN